MNLGRYSESKPLPSKEEIETLVERLPWSGCWIWMRGVDRKGYGYFKRTAQRWKAHRYSYELFRGPIGRLFVCHRCDNPSCINPEHLFLGTAADNQRDSLVKGRHASLRRGKKANAAQLAILRRGNEIRLSRARMRV